MSATQSRRARADRAGLTRGHERQVDAVIAKHETAIHATPELFATSGSPQAANSVDDRPPGDQKLHMTVAESRWAEFWAAADSGESLPHSEADDADGGDASETSSVLAGLMLERFDDDENWRKLARTGRAL